MPRNLNSQNAILPRIPRDFHLEIPKVSKSAHFCEIRRGPRRLPRNPRDLHLQSPAEPQLHATPSPRAPTPPSSHGPAHPCRPVLRSPRTPQPLAPPARPPAMQNLRALQSLDAWRCKASDGPRRVLSTSKKQMGAFTFAESIALILQSLHGCRPYSMCTSRPGRTLTAWGLSASPLKPHAVRRRLS